MARLLRNALCVVVATAMLLGGAPSAITAAPSSPGPVRSMAVIAPRWVYLDGDVGVGVRVTTRNSRKRITAELDILDETGSSRWHSVQSRTGLGSVTYEFSFSRAVRQVSDAPGILTLRARVTSAGSATAERTARLIVADRTARPVPVSIVVRVTGTPSASSTAGALALPDAESARLSATDATDLGRLASLHPEFGLTVAVPPYLLAEWNAARVSGETASGASPETEALDALRHASLDGTPLLRGMYADPDLAGIAKSASDLKRQMTGGDDALSALYAGEGIDPSAAATGFATTSPSLPASAAAILVSRGIRFVVAEAAAILPLRGAPAPGAYAVTVPGAGGSASGALNVLAADRLSSTRLTDPESASDLAASLFERISASRDATPVVLVISVGPGGMRTSALEGSLAALAGVPWIRLVTAAQVAGAGGLPRARLREDPGAGGAPEGYWTQVDAARDRVAGLLAAAGSHDADAQRALTSLLLSESRAWAGPDGSWPLAEHGLSLAREASDTAGTVLAQVTLEAPSVTLPGSEGKAPVSIMNASGRTLTVTLVAESSDVKVRRTRTSVRLRPGENVLSVPVALGTAPAGRVRFAVTAGGFRIASATATVRASYQDRIVLLATVLLILAALLFYIRRRMTRGRTSVAESGSDGDRE